MRHPWIAWSPVHQFTTRYVTLALVLMLVACKIDYTTTRLGDVGVPILVGPIHRIGAKDRNPMARNGGRIVEGEVHYQSTRGINAQGQLAGNSSIRRWHDDLAEKLKEAIFGKLHRFGLVQSIEVGAVAHISLGSTVKRYVAIRIEIWDPHPEEDGPEQHQGAWQAPSAATRVQEGSR